MLPSSVLAGANGTDLERLRDSSRSTCRRSSVHCWVLSRLLVRAREAAAASTSSLELVDVIVDASESEGDSEIGSFSLIGEELRAVLYNSGNWKPGFSSGYWRTLLRVTKRMSCPMGASLMMSAMKSKLKDETRE